MKFRNPIGTMILIVLLTFTLAACGAPYSKAPDAQALQGFIGADGGQPDGGSPDGGSPEGGPPNPAAAPPDPAAEQPAADAPQDAASADAAASESAAGESITRSYTFPDTNRSIPYRVYLPSSWTAEQSLPLVVILHGRGQDENSLFDGGPENAKGIVAKLAEQYHFIVAAPLGYTRSGCYGVEQTKPQDGMPAAGQMGGGPGGGQGGPGGGQPPEGGGQPPAGGPGGPGGDQAGQKPQEAQDGAQSGAAPAEETDDLSEEERANLVTYSEQDVLNVVSLVSQEFNVDTTRVFLTGTGTGGDGTMHLATKYPDLWLAIAPSEGGFDVTAYEASLPALKVKGAMLVQSGGAAAAEGQPSGGQSAADQGADGQASAGRPPAGRAGMRQVSADEMLEKLKSINVDARSVTIENARPSEAWFGAAEQIFAFFDAFARQ